MTLIRLIYASTARSDLHIADLMRIRSQARTHNLAHGIGGILCYGNGAFLQLLEGPRDAVNALYARILRDPRHSGSELLSYATIRTREYDGWSMNMISLDEPCAPPRKAAVVRHTSGRAFEPLRMTNRQAIAMLRDLAEVERAHLASLDERVTPAAAAPPSVSKRRTKTARPATAAKATKTSKIAK